MNELEKNYLEHSGVLGQRWGKRNGPPYPLDAKSHSKEEKEAGYKKSLGGGHNEDMYDRKTVKKKARQVTKQLNKMDKDLAYKKRDLYEANNELKRLSDKAGKKIAKGKELSKRDQKKVEKNAEKFVEAKNSIIRGEKEVNDILKSIDNDKFNVKEKETLRSVKRGSDYVGDVIRTVGTSILLTNTLGGQRIAANGDIVSTRYLHVSTRTPKVVGTKYKVKAKSKKELAKAKEDNYKKKMDLIQEKYDLAHEKEKEYLKKHPGAKEGEDYDFVEKFYTKADEEIEKKYKR